MSSPSSPEADLAKLEREIVDHLFVLQPSYAVMLGLHDYDGRVAEYSTAATKRWADRSDDLLDRLEGTPASSLPTARKTDMFLLRLLLEGPLFDLRATAELDHNPMSYLGAVSLTSYISRDYAPIPQRVDAVCRVLEQVPKMLDCGRERLKAPIPKPFLDLALAIGGGLAAHFAEAEEFAGRGGPELKERVRAVREPAEKAVTEFLAWLRAYHGPRTTDDFALGAARYQLLLFVREGIETPFEEIRRAGIADLARNQHRLEEIARAENVTVRERLERLFRAHPRADELIPAAREYVDETRRFVESESLVTIPAEARCRVEETPVWGRSLSTASMNPPGPFDRTSADGVYYVTPVDPKWTPQQQEEWLRTFNRPILRNVTAHEVFPGHYLQFLHFRNSPGSLTRKVYLSPSFTEGWAHYTEQLMIERGLGRESSDAEVAQIHDALLRNVRLLVSIGLHTRGMTLEEATRMFQTEAYFERHPAEREAIRGTFNPEYFCYTLGKLTILNARTRFLTSEFGGDLRAFHDTLLGLGCPPIGLLDSLLLSAKPH